MNFLSEQVVEDDDLSKIFFPITVLVGTVKKKRRLSMGGEGGNERILLALQLILDFFSFAPHLVEENYISVWFTNSKISEDSSQPVKIFLFH